ncbi:glycoside hydrolase superfamily [Thamnidium elegans]|nr:glycoside hydrolase superfamily [Thamnidium elegans]
MILPSLSTTAITLMVSAATYTKPKTIVSITTGVGWQNGLCVGNTYATTDPDFPGLCLQDAPLGVRLANNVTSGVAGINAAASFDKKFRGKGAYVQLGPAMNFIGGEDLYLIGVLGSETIKGIQGQGVITTAKHFLLNEQEMNRHLSSSDPFARSVEAGVGSIMCSYNLANGTYTCENEYLLNTVLKGEFGFKGFIHSDWGATYSTAESADGGLDMTMPCDVTMGSGGSFFGKNLTDAVNANQVSEDRATDMAMGIVATWFKVSLNSFDLESSPYVNVQEDHGILARKIASALVRLIACVGGALAQAWDSGTAYISYLVDPLTGLTEAFDDHVQVQVSLNDWNLEEAAETAKDYEFALCFRTQIQEKRLMLQIKAVADANKNTIVVIHSVVPALMPWINHPNIKAVLWSGLPGQESGNSLADLVTVKKKLFVGYKWFDHAKIEPLFPFGYGLSYTKFNYSQLKVETNASYGDSKQVVNEATARKSFKRLSFPSIAGSPPKQLRGFEKILLQKGEKGTVDFKLGKTELSIYGAETESWVIPSGQFKLHIGASSRDIRKVAKFTL